MDFPTVSIITRTRNRPTLLRRAAESVLGQQAAPAWEWIIVNDAGDPEAVRSSLAGVPGAGDGAVQVIHLNQSQGMEHASNVGLEVARGAYLAIHDDDDSWEPTFLHTMTAWLDEPAHAPFGGVVCHSRRIVERVTPEGIELLHEEPFNAHLEALHPWLLLEQNAFPPISFLFRRSLFKAVGPFDESLPVLGDWEFNLRALLQAPIGLIPKMLARYHHRPPGVTGSMANSITAADNQHRDWEARLRERWGHQPPAPRLPYFGALSRVAATCRPRREALQRLLSLPLRPGPQV